MSKAKAPATNGVAYSVTTSLATTVELPTPAAAINPNNAPHRTRLCDLASATEVPLGSPKINAMASTIITVPRTTSQLGLSPRNTTARTTENRGAVLTID